MVKVDFGQIGMKNPKKTPITEHNDFDEKEDIIGEAEKIADDILEKPRTICPYCEKDFINIKNHLKNCPKNPNKDILEKADSEDKIRALELEILQFKQEIRNQFEELRIQKAPSSKEFITVEEFRKKIDSLEGGSLKPWIYFRANGKKGIRYSGLIEIVSIINEILQKRGI